ncbi:hypothetical protein Ddye_019362 [Dipteronia dyeriana]|uniref:Uncharacterized protein n=1 Tax=Dipteronia dyeriana TaxID=168575 RepID=A0AAD9TXY8_9ROSI|nr:hypothetical protein Ddye_019362 [Dipteronia dyeriana]
MAGARRAMINGGNFSQRFSDATSRPTPKRGQIKVAILVGLAHSVASIFSHTSRRSTSHLS